MKKLTCKERERVIKLLIEYSQTGMLCITQEEKELIKRYCEEYYERWHK